MTACFIGGVFLLVCAVIVWSACHINKTPEPKVKPIDAIDEEIRRERIELHNTSLDYAELQGVKDRHTVVMLAAAFRMGAQWQQKRP